MKDKETFRTIIKNNGNCSGVDCKQCPICSFCRSINHKNKHSVEFEKDVMEKCKELYEKRYGKGSLKSDLVEELI